MLKHLKEKRGALLDKVEALLNKATTENRSLSTAEETQRAADMAAIKDLDTQIRAAQEVIDARSAQDALETRTAPAPRALGAEGSSGTSAREQRDIERYSITRAVNALLDGQALSGIEAEMHQEGLKELREAGLPRNGGNLVMPQLIMTRAGIQTRDLTATGGSSGSEGGATIQTNVGPIVERLRANLTLARLGATVMGGLSGNVAIPTFTANDAAVVKTEIAAAAESSPTFAQATMSPKRVPVFLEVSRQLLLQGQAGEEMIRGDLAYQIAKYIETMGINGSGSSNEPYGILNASGVGSVAGGTNGLAPSWDHIVDLESAVANADAATGRLAYLTNTKVRGKLKRTPIASNTAAAMIWDKQSPNSPLNEYLCEVSSLVPSTLTKGSSSGACSAIIFGNFADALIGQWGGVEFLVNPYSRDTEGLVRINAWTFYDFLVRRAASFAVMKDALTV
jgi:HK97 family phage major capsid protein